ncbi:hypothetical protein [Aestuariivita sp.]|jgi:hypothetical protein|uniref:hypothetical protein n=1 Tax=Aestuariivita sp. TaxID=1872407 RepID=UPI00216E03D2|nr:hypothetical protein [Aestuariivita sp.]MCE8008941.1 hypothetical protein [Aestuariivita sp.]
MSDEIHARIEVSQPRRWFGVGMLLFLGALLIYVALATPPTFEWQIFLIVTGAGALWIGDKMRRATAGSIEMTDDVIRDHNGGLIARLDEIENVERGFLAFKPSNGFLIKTRTPGPRRWEPGLWWRVGRRIGVGGVTSASQAKIMSDMISARLIMSRE